MRYPLSRVDLVYTAGLFDGEGCISIPKTKPSLKYRRITPSYELQIKITNNYLPVLDWLKENYGGSIYLHSVKLPRNPHPVGDWYLTATKASEFLQSISPYLKIKDKEAIVAIGFQEFKDKRFNKKAKKTISEVNIMEDAHRLLRLLKEDKNAVLETN